MTGRGIQALLAAIFVLLEELGSWLQNRKGPTARKE